MDGEKLTMYPMNIPAVDDSAITADNVTAEELEELLEAMILSNETIRAENDLLETYLENMDPQLIENMDSILDAATAAIHKAERTVQLGMMAAVTGLQDSSTTTPRSASHGSGKIAAFTLSDKGPKIQPSQKMEIIQREMDCQKTVFEENKKQNDLMIFNLECRKDTAEIRQRELDQLSKLLEKNIAKTWVNEQTMKIPGEKVITFFENRIRSDRALINSLMMKRKNLKIKIMAQNRKIRELGDELSYVDFEKLQIEDRALHRNLANLSLKVAGLKKANTVYLNVVGKIRDKSFSQMREARDISKSAFFVEKKIKSILKSEERVLNDIFIRQMKINHITDLTKQFTAPSVMDYIRHKDELFFTRQALKVANRKQRLYETIDNNLKRKAFLRPQSSTSSSTKKLQRLK